MADDSGQMEVDSDQNTNPNIGALKEAVKEAMEAVGNASANGEAKVNGLQNGEKGEDSLDQVNGNSEDKNGDSEDANGDSEEANGDSVDGDKDQNGDKNDLGESNEDNEDSQNDADEESSQDEDKHEEGMEVDGNESESNNEKDTITITKSTKPSDKSESDVVELDDSIDEETKQQKEDDDEVEETMAKGESDTVTITPKKKVIIEEVSIDDDAPSLRRSSRKKTPTKYHEIMERELQELSDQEDFEVEEVVDDGVEEIKDDDSDIQEVEAEDPLGNEDPFASSKSKSPNKDKPNVVTIDDLRTLQKLATSAKQSLDSQKKESLTIIDTNSILAGKMGSGVSITPARPRTESSLNITPASLNLGSGVTIKPNNSGAKMKGVSVTPVGNRNSASPSPSVGSNKSSDEKGSGSGFGYNAKGELTDPNLTDDTYVVEAPSFIVPYVYEKPPLETFQQFKKSIEKMIEENDREEKEKKEKERKEKEEERKKKKEKREKKQEEKEKRREERKKKRDEGEEVSDDSESEDEEEEDEEVIEPEEDKPKEAAKEEKKDDKDGNETEPKKAFFKSTLGKFFTDLGMNRVQEYVQADLLNQQKRKAQKDKSAAIMHAIMSLSKNLEDSRENNAHFKFDQKKCKFCSYRTESRTVMHHHMETPHMRNFIYRCNFCDYETKVPQEVLFHMEAEHNVKGKLERAPYFHQCPQCPFEDNGKGKLTRHKIGCDKRFKAETNLTPERDWDPPAKIRPPPQRPQIPNNMQGRYPGQMNQQQQQQQGGHYPNRPGIMPKQGQFQNNRMPYRNMANMQGGRGRPVGSYKPSDLRIPQPQLSNMSRSQMGGMRGISPQMLASQQMLAALNQQGLSVSGSMSGNSRVGNNTNLSVPNLNSGSVTIQSLGQRGGIKNTSPSISITPLPGRNNPGQNNKGRQTTPARNSPAMKPGQPGAGQGGGKGNFVICEICDGYIKDLEQLRNHMQWIHKVKIHPKMIYNRPPLNCQKCQFRFFTDQGLERHLLGSHGLVTASMQDAANKGQDSGRCPVCGKVYQWKLLNHVSKDHGKTLKPAHLSYKCTVCTATFGQYKLFENHVYTAHSGVAKKAEKAKQAAAAGKQQSMLKGQVKLSDEITIIPAKKTGDKPKPKSDEVINLDDEEEIDDVEDTEVIDLDNTPKKDKAEKGEASKTEKTATKRKLDEDEEPEAKKSKEGGDEESDK